MVRFWWRRATVAPAVGVQITNNNNGSVADGKTSPAKKKSSSSSLTMTSTKAASTNPTIHHQNSPPSALSPSPSCSTINHEHMFKQIKSHSPYSEHSLSVEQLADLHPLSRLDVGNVLCSRGLNEDEVRQRLKNEKKRAEKFRREWEETGKWHRRSVEFLKQVLNTFRMLLLIVAILCFLIFLLDMSQLCELVISGISFAVLILLCAVSYIEQLKTQKNSARFQQFFHLGECTVLRQGGTVLRVPTNELVTGDLIWLKSGDRIPADIRLLHTDGDFRAETSWITGNFETMEFVANPAPRYIDVFQAQNIVFGGFSCTAGQGFGIVIRTADDMLISRMIAMTSKYNSDEALHSRSALAVEHDRLVRLITIFSLSIATAVFICGLIMGGFSRVMSTFVNGFLIILVASVPQGLSVTLTAQLLITTRRLRKKCCGGMQCKEPDIADTLAVTSILMVDKTDVLTNNQPYVADVWIDNRLLETNELAKSPNSTHYPTGNEERSKTLRKLLSSMVATTKVPASLSNMNYHPKKSAVAFRRCSFLHLRRATLGASYEGKLSTPRNNDKLVESLQNGEVPERRSSELTPSIERPTTLSVNLEAGRVQQQNGLGFSPIAKAKSLEYENGGIGHMMLQNGLSSSIGGNYYPKKPVPPQLTAQKPSAVENQNDQLSPIDLTLVKFVERFDSVSELRNEFDIVYEVPFSFRRCHLVIVEKLLIDKDRDQDVNDNQNSENKSDKAEEKRYLLVVKGAPEEIIKNCSTIISNDGSVVPIEDEQLIEFEKTFLEIASQGHSCLAFANFEFSESDLDRCDADCTKNGGEGANYAHDTPSGTMPRSWSSTPMASEGRGVPFPPNTGWCFVGMVGLSDPPRLDASKAVSEARRAGVRLFMVTEDHPVTAEAIARQVGILAPLCGSESGMDSEENKSFRSKARSTSSSECHSSLESGSENRPRSWTDDDLLELDGWHLLNNDDLIVHGDSLALMKGEDLNKIIKQRNAVFARTTPAQKLQLIQHCQKLGHIVTLTGDGLLDALALKQSNVGIVPETSGSLFAKEASDIFCSDYSLERINKAIREGRLLFENFKKSIAYTLSHTVPEIVPILLSFIFGLPLGLGPLQILSIDVLTEIPPSIALMFEPPERDLMKQTPRKPTAKLLSGPLIFYSYVIAGIPITLGCFFAYMSVFWYYGLSIDDLQVLDAPLSKAASAGTTTLVLRRFSRHIQSSIHAQACAAWHITLVVSQMFHVWFCTTRRTTIFKHGIKNIYLVWAVLFDFVVLLTLIYVPKIRDVIGVEPPPTMVWFFPVVVGILLMLINESRKYCIKKYPTNRVIKFLRW